MSGLLVSNARRAFGKTIALDDVTIEAPEGQITALLGASGSGKSTLLRIVAGLEPLDSGTVRIGDDIVSRPGFAATPEARGVGLVFQDFALFPHMTLEANVAFGLAKLDRAERRAVAHRWLDRVGLGSRAGAYPHELSGGEQQRVALARALAPSPRVVLLDEPFSGLDPGLRTELRDRTLETLADSNAAAVFVTHDADEALYVADRIAILKSGRLLQIGPPREVYVRPASPDAAAALGAINLLTGVVREGAFVSPFGIVRSPGRADGAAILGVRAEALRLVPGVGASVVSRRPQGQFDLVTLEAGAVRWRALAPPGAPALGAETAVVIDPAGAHVW
jgi:iron(III) transport system ATP-binding protein